MWGLLVSIVIMAVVDLLVAMGVFMGVFMLMTLLVFMSMRVIMSMLMSMFMGMLLGMAMTVLLSGRATWLWLPLTSTATSLLFMLFQKSHLLSLLFFGPLFKLFNKLGQSYFVFWSSDQFRKLAPKFVVRLILLLRLLLKKHVQFLFFGRILCLDDCARWTHNVSYHIVSYI